MDWRKWIEHREEDNDSWWYRKKVINITIVYSSYCIQEMKKTYEEDIQHTSRERM